MSVLLDEKALAMRHTQTEEPMSNKKKSARKTKPAPSTSKPAASAPETQQATPEPAGEDYFTRMRKLKPQQRYDVKLAGIEKRLKSMGARISGWSEVIGAAVEKVLIAIDETRKGLHALPEDFKPATKRGGGGASAAANIEVGKTQVRIRDKHKKTYDELLPTGEALTVVGIKAGRLAVSTPDGKAFVPRGHVEIVPPSTEEVQPQA